MTAYLTTDEAAERLRETAETVARQCAAGLIPASRATGRWLIAESVIEAMLEPTNTGRSRVRSTVGRRRAS